VLAFFLIVLGVPVVLVALAFVFLDGISWKEALMIVGVEFVVAASSAGITSCANTHDTEIWNGRVTGKSSQHVSCSHSYQCHCHQVCTGSGKNRSCNEECDTCYEHSYDVDWDVYDNVGQMFEIARVDRQGLDEPSRYRSVQVGEPTSSEHSYDNYVKAAPDSLFRHQGLEEKYETSLPDNPQKIYDYYRLNRIVTVDVTLSNEAEWNDALSNLNADLGHKKQANVILVIVKNCPQDWYYALEEKWIGGKKNDVVLVVSVDDDMKPQWATVMCWTTSELFKVKLHDDVMNDVALTKDAVMNDLRTNVDQYFVRKPMSSFEYLKSSIVPSMFEWFITLFIAIGIGGGLIYVCQTNDIFGDERRTRFY
jgi:hypothetical protein